ncbi:hypothetical protein OROHE_005045 [Orobanche hederae]
MLRLWDMLKSMWMRHFFEDSLEMGIGMVIHDDLGEFICCRSVVRPGLMGIVEGKVWGVVEAIRWAIYLGLQAVTVETDSRRMADAIKAVDEADSVLSNLVEEGHHLLEATKNFSILWVNVMPIT